MMSTSTIGHSASRHRLIDLHYYFEALWCFAALIMLINLSACEDEVRFNPVCDPGYFIDESGERCIRPSRLKTCSGVNAIGESCQAENRLCVDSPNRDAICGGCVGGYKELEGTCISVLTCADLDCASSAQSCNEALDHFDAQCGECLQGYRLINGMCRQPSCEPSDLDSIYYTCAQENRVCDMESVQCGDCLPGFRSLSSEGPCSKVLTCRDIGKSDCDPVRRICIDSDDPSIDSACGGCIINFEEVDGVCQPIPAAATCEDSFVRSGEEPTGINWFDYCLEQRRVCEVVDRDASDITPGEVRTRAQCGSCIEGYALDIADTEGGDDLTGGVCVEVVPCDVLGCDELNRACEEGASIECGRCLEGYTQDLTQPESCRELITCDDLNCEDIGTSCTPHGANTDAYCEVNCGLRSIFNGRECTPCPPCQGEGESGISRRPTAAGYCVCDTTLGYFYSTSGEIGTFPCDADNDGWLRENARLAMESDDPVLRSQAKCSLQKIHSVKLVNEHGDEKLVALDDPLPLYETLKNDDQQLLEGAWREQNDYPSFDDPRALQASTLNRFTKLCYALKADFNDNGIEDILEWGEMPRSPTMRIDQTPFNQFSYFAELHTGVFEYDPLYTPPLNSDENESYGVYVIMERSRQDPSNQFNGVQISSEDNQNSYWRECVIEDDRGWGMSAPPIGLDFSGEAEGSFGGMRLHSLFKCLYVTAAPDDQVPTHLTPTQVTRRSGLMSHCEPNAVSGSSAQELPTNGLMGFKCDAVEAQDAEGKVVWSIEPYQRYLSEEDYVRGCVNSCSEQRDDCAERSGGGDIPTTCISDTQNFGKRLGCQVWEICDGQDNDNDGVSDEDLPNTLIPCQTYLPGVCSEGRLLCLPSPTDPRVYEEICVMDAQINDVTLNTTPPFQYCGVNRPNECVYSQLKLGFSVSDIDGDGRIQNRDNCPHTPNPSQSDLDRDDLGDICDQERVNYPTYPVRPIRVTSDLLDSDYDGFYDHEDDCPQVSGNFCGVDLDGDGLLGSDLCPERYSPQNVDSDGDGDGNACDSKAMRPQAEYIDAHILLTQTQAQLIHGGAVPQSYSGEDGQLVEYCNGIDDDCDGRIDEAPIYNNPNDSIFPNQRANVRRLVKPDGEGEECVVPARADHPMLGICSEGHYLCDQGEITCLPDHDVDQIYDRSRIRREDVNVACDGIDNDCDGDIDEPDQGDKFKQGQSSTCPEPYRSYFVDFDQDGYGVNGVAICACGDRWGLVDDLADGRDLALSYIPANYISDQVLGRRPTSKYQITSRGAGDCCDVTSAVAPNISRHRSDPLEPQCISGPLTHDWNCDGNNEDENIGVDTSEYAERRTAINDLVGPNWRWTESAQYYTENGYSCHSFRNYFLNPSAARSSYFTTHYNRGERPTCVDMWQDIEPQSCGDRHLQVSYLLFNDILYSLPINPRYLPKKCR